jgi:transcriptional regulator with XRE-family HTH domain
MDYTEADRILSGVMDRLHKERKRQGVSLQKLGALSGVEHTTIAKAEKGQRSPSLLICLRIADALGLDLEDVLKSARKSRRRGSSEGAALRQSQITRL